MDDSEPGLGAVNAAWNIRSASSGESHVESVAESWAFPGRADPGADGVDAVAVDVEVEQRFGGHLATP